MDREWDSAPNRTRKDTKSWLQNSLWASVIITLGGGGLSALIIAPDGSSALLRFGLGVLGAAVTIAIIIGIAYLTHLLITPYRQRDEARGDVDKLEKRIEPQLIIEDVKKENYGNVAGFIWGLVVRNKGTDREEECIGELVAIDFADKTGMSLNTWPVNQPLQWGNISEYSSDTISIVGGSRAVLQVINNDFVNRAIGMGPTRMNAQHIAYSKSYEFRETHYLPVSNYPNGNNYLIVIGISSKGKLPVFAVCYLKSRESDDYCKMKLLEVVTEEPNIGEYRQKSVARIAEIEKQLASEWYHEIGMDSHDC